MKWRRAMVVLASAGGNDVAVIAGLVQTSPDRDRKMIHRFNEVATSLAGDTVQIRVDGQLVRTHPIRHDRAKEHGAFATPTGRRRRINAA